MSRILKVNQSDYTLQVQSGGNIVLDTGDNAGVVTVTGNLVVQGDYVTVNVEDMRVEDNIILLNKGETGDGINSTVGYQAGIEIERGSRNNAMLVFSEQVNHYDSVVSDDVVGTFRLLTVNDPEGDGTGNVTLSGLQVRTIANDGTADLMFDMRSGSSVLKIANSPGYESRVVNDNHIPNRKYVSDYVSATGGTANVSDIHYPLTGTRDSSVTATSTTIDFAVGLQLRAQISSAGLAVNNVLVAGNTVTNTSVNNLILTAATNNVEVNAVLNLDNQASDPSAVSGATKIYTKAAEGPGRTGIYFANNTPNADELVSKNRAVLLSILL